MTKKTTKKNKPEEDPPGILPNRIPSTKLPQQLSLSSTKKKKKKSSSGSNTSSDGDSEVLPSVPMSSDDDQNSSLSYNKKTHDEIHDDQPNDDNNEYDREQIEIDNNCTWLSKIKSMCGFRIKRKYWLSRVTNNDDEIEYFDKNSWYGLRLKDAPKFIQNDKEIVTTATYNSYGFAFEFASPELRQDKDFVLQVVQQYGDGFALQFASPEVQQDKQVVMAAVKSSNGWAFEFASPELQQEKYFVLQLVQQKGNALKYVSPELQQDKQVVIAAINNDPDVIKFAHEDLKRDPDVLIAAGMFDEDHDTIRQQATKNTRKIVFSTRFALAKSGKSEATNFTCQFKRSGYFRKEGDFSVYSPNAFDKKTCDPDWTNFDWPCRGTTETCLYRYNILTDDGRPTNDCCWRYSFRSQLQEAKNTGGFMLQLVETEPTVKRGKAKDATLTVKHGKAKDATLGNGQKIELDMANTIGIKVFHVYRPEENGFEWGFQDRHINVVTAEIASWYDNQCQDMSLTVIRQRF